MDVTRCSWARSPLMIAYHDAEWGVPVHDDRRALREIPPKTAESDTMSRDLIKRGFKFVGSTICYAYMQAVGLANDHTVDCFRRTASAVATGELE